MANWWHVLQLKRGAKSWNKWRYRWADVFPDLVDADLSRKDLGGANLAGADLAGADLTSSSLGSANLIQAKLRNANLSNAILDYANLKHADLRDANLSNTRLYQTYLGEAKLNDTNLHGARMRSTVLAHLDLRATKGLAEIIHEGPSHITLHTVQLPHDGSALHFLRGVGLPDEYIDFWQATTIQPIQYHSVFISYSSKDETLARRLHADLQVRGVRCWFAPEDLKVGSKFRQCIDEAIHLQDKLLLLLSKHSIASTWVENEIEAALEKEDRQKRDVLFPVRLDDEVMQTPKAWAATLRRSRHIGDFSNWTDPQAYQMAFKRLLDDLKKTYE